MADPLTPPDPGTTFGLLAALCEPVRRDLYFFVAGRDGWVSRDDAAAALGLRRGLVAHHLDRLADVGLVDVEYRRLTGRSGPGAGRPSKLYRRAEVEFLLAIPARNTALMGQLLAEALARAGPAADSVRRRLRAIAHKTGRDIGARARRPRSDAQRHSAFVDLLSSHGYEPRAGDGALRLVNCPYEPIAEHERDVVCNTNLALVRGVAEALGLPRSRCSLRPPEGGCCVQVSPWPAGSNVAPDG